MGVRQRETNDLPRRSDFREFGQLRTGPDGMPEWRNGKK
jgi:hypothetical protein